MSVDLKPYIVAHYKMNDNADSTVVLDSSGNGYHGTAQQNTSVLTAAGKVGGALSFNGTSDYIDTGQYFQDTFRDSFSINLWCKLGDAVNLQDIFGVVGTNNPIYGSCWIDVYPEINQIRAAYSTVWPFENLIDTTVTMVADEWFMITFKVQNIEDTSVAIFLYVDGVCIGSNEQPDAMSDFSTIYTNLVGWTGNAPSGYILFKGVLDNVMIFDKALSQDEIDFLYNGGEGTEELFEKVGMSYSEKWGF